MAIDVEGILRERQQSERRPTPTASTAGTFDADSLLRQVQQEYRTDLSRQAVQRERAQGGAIRQAPPVPRVPIGGIAGSIGLPALAAATGPVGFPTAVGLGMLGAAGGEAYQQHAERALGKPAPKTSFEAVKEMGKQALIQGAGDVAFRGLGIGKNLLKAPTTPEGEKAATTLENLAQGLPAQVRPLWQGGPSPSRITKPLILPVEQTESPALDWMYNIAREGLGGKSIMQRYEKGYRMPLLKDIQDDMLNRIAKDVTPDQAARQLVQSVKGNLKMAQFPADMMYSALDKAASPTMGKFPSRMTVSRTEQEITKPMISGMKVERTEQKMPATFFENPPKSNLEGLNVTTTYQDVPVGNQLQRLKVMTTWQDKQMAGPTINIGAIKSELQPLLAIAEQAGGPEGRAMGRTILEFIAQKPDVVSYPVAKQMRTEVRTIQNMLEKGIETKNAPGIGKAKLVYGKMTREIEEGLKQYDPFLARMWKEANFLEAGAQGQYNSRVIRSLMPKAVEQFKADPQSLLKAIESQGPEPIKIWRNAADPASWQSVQRIYAQGMMEKAGMGKGQGLQGGQWVDEMVGTVGNREKMKAIYTPQQIKGFQDYAEALRTIQQKQLAGEGTVWIALRQSSAIGSVIGLGSYLYGGKPAESIGAGVIAALTTPPVLAWVLTHPTYSHMFIRSIQAPPSSGVAWSTLGKIAAAVPNTLWMQPEQPVSQPQAKPALPQLPTGMTPRPLPLQP